MVTGRKPSLRIRILAVLTSLVALWAFAAYVTVGEGVSLVWLATLEQQVAKPTEALLAALQEERRISVEFAALGPAASRYTLDSARRVTDQAVARQRAGMESTIGQWSTSNASDARLADLFRGLELLPMQREAIDAGAVGRIDANREYTDLIQLGFDVYDTYAAWDDSDVIYMANTVVLLTHSQEMISREDALLAGVIGAGSFTADDRQTIAELVGAQRYLSRQVFERLPEPDRTDYAGVLSGSVMSALRALETELTLRQPGTLTPDITVRWRATAAPAIEAVRQLVIMIADRIVMRVRPAAIWIIARLVLAAGLGLIAVVASIRFTIRVLRSLQRQLAQLRVAALDLAHQRLPDVVERLRRGEEVDAAAASPPLTIGSDDVGLVAAAFNVVQQTAIQATVDQAELKRGVRDTFVSLAHRIQALVHRQLKLIDTMERQATDAEELAGLYRVDHLATRMRRNAENLIVLAGMPPSRTWRRPVSMVDVLRAALAEVEDYPRVMVHAADAATLSGRAAGDVIHLLAELMENAVSFSPPQAEVQVTGRNVYNGYLVEIEDRGLGMTADDLRSANARLADPPDFQLTSAARLGFFVVGRLAQRYGIGVHLRRSTHLGVVAEVLIPPFLFGEDDYEPDLVPTMATVAVPAIAAPAGTERFTPAGLPVRVRRPATSAPVVALSEPDGERGMPNGRTPQEVSRLIAAYAEAARRGRERAEPTDMPAEPTPNRKN